jgi:hypothetical protein
MTPRVVVYFRLSYGPEHAAHSVILRYIFTAGTFFRIITENETRRAGAGD